MAETKADKAAEAAADKAAEAAANSARKAFITGQERDAARQKAHDDELARQKAVADAVYAATHDKDGDPIPLVAPEPEV
jgi:hypothetical protein